MKLFKQNAVGAKDASIGRDGQTLEPSEIRFRKMLLRLGIVAGPLLLLTVFIKLTFSGLVVPEALDYAQLGRNLSQGHGFVTQVVRPLALSHGSNPNRQPDLVHGPIYPFILALAFGALGAKDTTAAAVSAVFYYFCIPIVYLLGLRLFNRTVGMLTALIFTVNALTLQYATSGLPVTLIIFLTTFLMLTLYNIAATARDNPSQASMGKYIIAGILMALLYLTEPFFFWIVPFIMGAIYLLAPTQKFRALFTFLVPMCLLMSPWMIREASLTGNPIFGLRGLELWMNTRGNYPGLTAYRMFPAEMIPGTGLFNAVLMKTLQGAGAMIQEFPQVTASWVLAFFLPCLLFRFTDSATNALRQIMIACLAGVFLGNMFFFVQMPLFLGFLPVMLMFSIAYLLHLIEQAKMTKSALVMTTLLMGTAVVFPLPSQLFLEDKNPGLKEIGVAKALGKTTHRDEMVLSDQPWVVAWYADRTAIWMPVSDGKITDVRKMFPMAHWLFLTDGIRSYSGEWEVVYELFAHWNLAYMETPAGQQTPDAITFSGNQFPLMEALNGFTSIPPFADTSSSVVLASAPIANPKVSMSSDAQGTNSAVR